MFEIKQVTLRDKKTGKRKTRYYAEVSLAGGRTIPLILANRPMDLLEKLPR